MISHSRVPLVWETVFPLFEELWVTLGPLEACCFMLPDRIVLSFMLPDRRSLDRCPFVTRSV